MEIAIYKPKTADFLAYRVKKGEEHKVGKKPAKEGDFVIVEHTVTEVDRPPQDEDDTHIKSATVPKEEYVEVDVVTAIKFKKDNAAVDQVANCVLSQI